MMVTFISQCEKKAHQRTRRVLDAFAGRIGDNTWQTVITQEGLLAVKKLLRKTASKNTAVSCHWIRSRSRTELVWVVGNKGKFNERGVVPVNSTLVNRPHRDDQADWHYLPLIQALTSLAALFHDWGKASKRFQQKLGADYKGRSGDAIRHEWVSCLLLKALISTTDANHDDEWLSLLQQGSIDEKQLKKTDFDSLKKPLAGLPPIARFIAWLVVSHHRLPTPALTQNYQGEPSPTIDDLLAVIDKSWGYENNIAAETYQDCLQFPNGLLSDSKPWLKAIKRWAAKLLSLKDTVEQVLSDGSYRVILHHARLSLMLGDHYFSSLSLKETGQWHSPNNLIANTQKDSAGKGRCPKQALDQHLVGVYKYAKHNVHNLPDFEKQMPRAQDIHSLKKNSPKTYAWQDTAARKIKAWKVDTEKRQGFFAVNMASTGCGKTFANAKVMRALSEDGDSLRYILALGLRTLTLQTGEEYRKRIFQQSDGSELAVLIGSKAITELHQQSQSTVDDKRPYYEQHGSESEESLLGQDEEIDYNCDIPEEELATVLKKKKDRQFLYAPVLACTIDHIMGATETTRGGRYILPSLRLMSSDLVIDEVDDFTGDDLIAIGRLIHLAGMLGRKVMISSATIPPALAEGYFNAYREGWQLYAKTRNASKTIGCAWIDEFRTEVADNTDPESSNANLHYQNDHNKFIEKRIKDLAQQPARRKANITTCQHILNEYQQGNPRDKRIEQTKQQAYFNLVAKEALVKHAKHHTVDDISGLAVSFGVVRTANIPPCIALTRYLLEYDWPENTEVRTMAYHSQQVLLLRHSQEKHLDRVLKRKEATDQQPEAFSNKEIRHHLDTIVSSDKSVKNLIFILVATPVEEVGRDHDFDWAIVEPSSYRSIVQLAGRVRRHRNGAVIDPNISLLQYNWKTVAQGDQRLKPYFSRPGYESTKKMNNGKTPCFKTHNMSKLVDVQDIAGKLDAIPRIQTNPKIKYRIAELEHAVTADLLTCYKAAGPESLQGYLTHHWYITGLPQKLCRFRKSEPNITLFLTFDSKNNCYFTQKDTDGLGIKDDVYGEPIKTILCEIETIPLTDSQRQRLWLHRKYKELLQQQAETNDISLYAASLRYGDLTVREPGENQSIPKYHYNNQLGLFKK
ncbi:MAG: type I-F CRISPR-associated helicase Cas3f [Ostreibacterium sp.]